MVRLNLCNMNPPTPICLSLSLILFQPIKSPWYWLDDCYNIDINMYVTNLFRTMTIKILTHWAQLFYMSVGMVLNMNFVFLFLQTARYESYHFNVIQGHDFAGNILFLISWQVSVWWFDIMILFCPQLSDEDDEHGSSGSLDTMMETDSQLSYGRQAGAIRKAGLVVWTTNWNSCSCIIEAFSLYWLYFYIIVYTLHCCLNLIVRCIACGSYAYLKCLLFLWLITFQHSLFLSQVHR